LVSFVLKIVWLLQVLLTLFLVFTLFPIEVRLGVESARSRGFSPRSVHDRMNSRTIRAPSPEPRPDGAAVFRWHVPLAGGTKCRERRQSLQDYFLLQETDAAGR